MNSIFYPLKEFIVCFCMRRFKILHIPKYIGVALGSFGVHSSSLTEFIFLTFDDCNWSRPRDQDGRNAHIW